MKFLTRIIFINLLLILEKDKKSNLCANTITKEYFVFVYLIDLIGPGTSCLCHKIVFIIITVFCYYSRVRCRVGKAAC